MKKIFLAAFLAVASYGMKTELKDPGFIFLPQENKFRCPGCPEKMTWENMYSMQETTKNKIEEIQKTIKILLEKDEAYKCSCCSITRDQMIEGWEKKIIALTYRFACIDTLLKQCKSIPSKPS